MHISQDLVFYELLFRIASQNDLVEMIKALINPLFFDESKKQRIQTLYRRFSYLVSVDSGGVVKVWDMPSKIVLQTFDCDHNYPTLDACLSPDGNTIVIAYKKYECKVFDVATGSLIQILKSQYYYYATCVRYSPDGRYIASGNMDGTIQCWNASTGSYLYTPVLIHCISSESDTYVCFSPNGQYLASRSDASRVAGVWDIQKGQPFREFKSSSCIAEISFSPDGQYFALVSNRDINVWNISENSLLYTLEHPSSIHTFCYSRLTGRYLVVSCDNMIIAWDLSHNPPVKRRCNPVQQNVYQICYSPDAKYLVVCRCSSSIGLWSHKNLTPFESLRASNSFAIKYARFLP